MNTEKRIPSCGAVPAQWMRSTPIASNSYQGFVSPEHSLNMGTAHCAKGRRSVLRKPLISLNCAVRSVSGYYVPPAELRRGAVP